MKLQITKDNLNNCGPPPPIFYKTKPTIDKILVGQYNHQPGEKYSNTTAIYVPLFHMGSPESILKFVTLLNKIIRGQDLSTVPQKFVTKRNLVVRDPLRVFEQNT